MDLWHAAEGGLLSRVREFVEQGIDVNTVNQTGQTALFCACGNGHYDVAELLLKNGALVNCKVKPLIAAVRNGHKDCVDLLLKHGADTNCINAKRQSPMTVALEKMNVGVILSLLDHGAIPHIPLEGLLTKLFTCAVTEHASMFHKLLKNGILSIETDECLTSALQFSFEHSSQELALYLLSVPSSGTIQQIYPSAVYYSAMNKWYDILTELLKEEVDVNAMTDARTPLYAACEQLADDVVSLLLQNGADPNLLCSVRKESALHVACTTDGSRGLSPGQDQRNAGDVDSGKNVRVVQQLLKHGANINALCDEGQTALYRACKSRQVEVVRLLLDAGADANLSTSDACLLNSVENVTSGLTTEPVPSYPLWMACKNGDTDIVIDLLKNGASTELVNVVGETALRCAIKHIETLSSGPSPVVRSLIEYGAPVNAISCKQETPLYLACERGLTGVVQQLIQSNADANLSHCDYPLIVACQRNFMEIVSLLLNGGANVNLTDVSPSFLIAATDRANSGLVKELLNHGAEINSVDMYGNTALHIAVSRMRYREYSSDDVVSTIRSLLNHGGANLNAVNGDGETALCLAYSLLQEYAEYSAISPSFSYIDNIKYMYDVVQMLLQSGADPNIISVPEQTTQISSRTRPFKRTFLSPMSSVCKISLLSHAARQNDVPLMKLLLKCDAQLEVKDTLGQTALYYALEPVKGNKKMSLKFLLQSGAQVNVLDDDGISPLTVACSNGDLVLVKTLLNSGADPNLPTTAVYPLSLACQYRYYEIVELLLKHGADMQATNVNSEPPLCETLTTFDDGDDAGPDSYIAHLLLDYGADPNVMTSFKQTPLYLACLNNFTALVRKMLKCGAKVSISKNQKSPLNVACRNKHRAIVKLLLAEGADPNVPEEIADRCLYALHVAFAGSNNKPFVDCSKSLTDIVNLLLRYGADPNVVTSSGESPLYLACLNNLPALVQRLLIIIGDKVNIGKNQKSPLNVACRKKYMAIVKLLLEAGVDPNVPEEIGDTCTFALHIAATGDSNAHVVVDDNDQLTMIASLLLDYGADTNVMTPLRETPLYLACLNNLTALVQIMLKSGAKVNVSKNQKSPLNAACRNKHRLIAELLLNEGADPNVPEEIADKSSYALHIAVAGDNKHADDCGDNNEMFNLLLQHGANVHLADGSGNNALHQVMKSCRANSQSLLDALLNAGVDVNICNNGGESPLYLAVGKFSRPDDVTNMRNILSHGANPNLTTTDKFPLCVACETQNLTFVNALLEAGANPNLIDSSNSGDSGREVVITCELPLCIATKKANPEITELLLNSGAKVNALNLRGKSALHFAVEKLVADHDRSASCNQTVHTCKSAKLVKLLLEHGADVNQLMPDGNSPLSLLLHHDTRYFWHSSAQWIQYRQSIDETVLMMISRGANLADSSNNLGRNFEREELRILRSLCALGCTDHGVVDLLKAGAGFKLLAYYCVHKSNVRHNIGVPAKSVRVCQAAIMAGYVPSSEELADMHQSVSGEDINPVYVELLSWLNEESQRAQSLMRQCRVVIRRQLSVASHHRTILPAIDQLPLPNRLKQYLKFEGLLTETDLST